MNFPLMEEWGGDRMDGPAVSPHLCSITPHIVVALAEMEPGSQTDASWESKAAVGCASLISLE